VNRFTRGQVSGLPDKEFRWSPCSTLVERTALLAEPALHVAMQSGPSLYPMSRTSDVWSLRILISSCLGFWRFIVCMISRISIKPPRVR
jgi:hypothetical protein